MEGKGKREVKVGPKSLEFKCERKIVSMATTVSPGVLADFISSSGQLPLFFHVGLRASVLVGGIGI